ERDLAPLDALDWNGPGPALDLHRLGFKVGGGFVGQQRGHFGSELAEGLGAVVAAPHEPELVLHQRMADLDDLHCLAASAGVRATIASAWMSVSMRVPTAA